MRKFALTLSAAILFSATPLSAGAVTYDFTDENKYDVGDLSDSLIVGGSSVSATLSGSGTLSFTNFDGGGLLAPLALDHDGVGVGDDEITVGSEYIDVAFSETVAVTGFHFLDLFKSNLNTDAEVAEVWLGGVLTYSFTADLLFQQMGGYSFAPVSPFLADMLRFTAGVGNDGVGVADYALAGIDVQAVPLPAAIWLLLSALGGLGLVSRRRTAVPA